MKNILYTIIISFLFSSSVFAESFFDMEKKLAEQGDATAQFNLGLSYDEGQGVTQDYKEAAKWYRLAAEQGYAKAQFNLALMYYEGKGVTQNYKETAKWYRLAAKQGVTDAKFYLALIHGAPPGLPCCKFTKKRRSKSAKKNRDVTENNMTSEPIEIIKNTTSSEAMKLRELNQLYEEGVLTEDEFNLKKKELLDKM